MHAHYLDVTVTRTWGRLSAAFAGYNPAFRVMALFQDPLQHNHHFYYFSGAVFLLFTLTSPTLGTELPLQRGTQS